MSGRTRTWDRSGFTLIEVCIIIEDQKAGFEYGKDLIARVGDNNPSVHFANDAVHRGNGNILLGDGSVQQYSSQDLREQLRTTGELDNLWAQPGNSHP